MQLLIGHLGPRRIAVGIRFRFHYQPRCRGRPGDQLHHGLQAHQRPAPPIGGDVAEQAGFDLVPLSGPPREVAGPGPPAPPLPPPPPPHPPPPVAPALAAPPLPP